MKSGNIVSFRRCVAALAALALSFLFAVPEVQARPRTRRAAAAAGVAWVTSRAQANPQLWANLAAAHPNAAAAWARGNPFPVLHGLQVRKRARF
jgi:hypothetical protein